MTNEEMSMKTKLALANALKAAMKTKKLSKIQFQKIIHIPKLALGLLYGIVHCGKRLFQSAGIAADLHCNAFDPARHVSPPPENGHRKSTYHF